METTEKTENTATEVSTAAVVTYKAEDQSKVNWKGEVAGVYGRQQPMSFSSDNDKRDLVTVFGLDKKTQKKDPFFHNANSMFRRDIWNEIPFDEEVTNIEDRVWGKFYNLFVDKGIRNTFNFTFVFGI